MAREIEQVAADAQQAALLVSVGLGDLVDPAGVSAGGLKSVADLELGQLAELVAAQAGAPQLLIVGVDDGLKGRPLRNSRARGSPSSTSRLAER